MTGTLPWDEDAAFMLADDAATVSRIVRMIPADRLRSTKLGDWSALDVIGHVADAAERFADRIQRCIDEDNPDLPWLDDEPIVIERRATRDPMACAKLIHASHSRIARMLREPGVASRRCVLGPKGSVDAAYLGAYQARHAHEHVGELARLFPPV